MNKKINFLFLLEEYRALKEKTDQLFEEFSISKIDLSLSALLKHYSNEQIPYHSPLFLEFLVPKSHYEKIILSLKEHVGGQIVEYNNHCNVKVPVGGKNKLNLTIRFEYEFSNGRKYHFNQLKGTIPFFSIFSLYQKNMFNKKTLGYNNILSLIKEDKRYGTKYLERLKKSKYGLNRAISNLENMTQNKNSLTFPIQNSDLSNKLFSLLYLDTPTDIIRRIKNYMFKKLSIKSNAISRRFENFLLKKIFIKRELENSANSVNIQNRPIFLDISSPKGNFLVGTTSGLWILTENGAYRLTSGYTYGITTDGNRWYASQKMQTFSRIISFDIFFDKTGKPQMINIENVLTDLKTGIHQIDYYLDHLYIVDTIGNRLIKYNLKTKCKKNIYPNKRIKNTRSKFNNHFNSVFVTKESIHVLAHNGTLKKDTVSQIYILNGNKKPVIIDMGDNCQHNSVLIDENYYHCDSKNGRLLYGDKLIFQNKDFFTRGLAITDKYFAIGGSEFAERSQREFSSGAIFFVDREDIDKVTKLPMTKTGQIFEIRCLEKDHALSSKKG